MPNAATEQPAPLPVTAFQSAREYRKACHLAHVTANAKDWRASDKHPATKILAARVGTSKRTLWRYEREQVDAGELHKKQRFDKIALADGEKLTDEEKANGWHIRIIDGNRYKVGNYRTSIRSAVLLDDFEQFAVSELGAVIEPPAAGETASEPHDSSMTRYCRNCGQVARADFHLPRVCGYCEATGADLWHTQPPNIAPEVLAVRNGRRRE
jgi:hypothetical protein